VQVDVRPARDLGVRAAGAPAFRLPRGLPSASVTVTGAGGPPRVTITGPRGERAASDPRGRAVDTGQFVILPMRGQHETLIGIEHPAAGRWTIAQQPGSPAITSISHADGLPPASVAVTVTGRGARRVLRYRIRPREGQSVTFAERAGHVFHILGSARASRGRLTFMPAPGPSGRRKIVALIALSGVQSRELVVGSYTARVPVLPGAPRRLRVSRRGRVVIATWRPAARAAAYAAIVRLSDGRRLGFSLGARQRRITIPTLIGGLGASVTVIAVGGDGRTGPATRASLASAPRPGRVTGIIATPSSAGVIVHWRRVRGAVRYLVTITAGGVSYVELSGLTHLRPSLDLAALKRGVTAVIAVKAMSRDGKLGPPGVGVYRTKRRGGR
jgi:hypothetical protein